jgi:hypothetical protein
MYAMLFKAKGCKGWHFSPFLTFFDHFHCRNPETGLEAGDWITRERDYANHMFIVVRGSAAVKDGNDTVLRFKAGLAKAETHGDAEQI